MRFLTGDAVCSCVEQLVVLTAAELWRDRLIRDYKDYYYRATQIKCFCQPWWPRHTKDGPVSICYARILPVQKCNLRRDGDTAVCTAKQRVQHTAACTVVLVAFEVSSRIRRVS